MGQLFNSSSKQAERFTDEHLKQVSRYFNACCFAERAEGERDVRVIHLHAEVSFTSFTGLTKQPCFSSVSPQGELLACLPQQNKTILRAYRASTD